MSQTLGHCAEAEGLEEKWGPDQEGAEGFRLLSQEHKESPMVQRQGFNLCDFASLAAVLWVVAKGWQRQGALSVVTAQLELSEEAAAPMTQAAVTRSCCGQMFT